MGGAGRGGVALTWFALRCLGRADPLLELRLFGRRPFTAGIVAALGTTFSMVGAMLLLAQWLQLADGASPMAAGVRLLPVATAGVAASLLAPPLARLLGARTVLAVSPAVTGTGLLVLALAPGPLDLPAVLTALALIGAGTGSLAVGSALIMSGAPEEQAGSAGALEETSYELGAALGVAVLGTVAGQVYRARLTDTPALHDAPPNWPRRRPSHSAARSGSRTACPCPAWPNRRPPRSPRRCARRGWSAPS
ncbi:MFS transporter [Streptomyces albus]|nr:MFS transporter [Streptomyces albus]